MKISLYVIKDQVLEQSGPIYEAKNDGIALRNFLNVMKQNEFATDFELYCVGWYDHDKDEGSFHAARFVTDMALETEREGEDNE